MRWKTPIRKPVCDGDRQIFRRFMWFPLTLNGETRWLEFANVVCEYEANGYAADGRGWVPVAFSRINPDQNEGTE